MQFWCLETRRGLGDSDQGRNLKLRNISAEFSVCYCALGNARMTVEGAEPYPNTRQEGNVVPRDYKLEQNAQRARDSNFFQKNGNTKRTFQELPYLISELQPHTKRANYASGRPLTQDF